MSILDKKGIGVTSGFKLVSGAPIDARFTAEDETDLQSLIDNGAVYEGLEVYVKSLGKKKVYNGTEFVEVSGGASNDFITVTELPHIGDPKINKTAIYRLETIASSGSTDNTIPTRGALNKVYINRSLSKNEILDILKSLEYHRTSDYSVDACCVFYVLFNNDGKEVRLFARNQFNNNEQYSIMLSIYGLNYITLWDDYSGWFDVASEYIDDDNYLVQECTGALTDDEYVNAWNGAPIGTQNEKVKELINTGLIKEYTYYQFKNGKWVKFGGKVFEDVSEIPAEPDENIIYRISEVSDGTIVPNTGHVEKVYLNTNLTDDEITELCKKLVLYLYDSGEVVLSSDNTLTNSITVCDAEKMAGGKGYMLGTFDVPWAYYISPKNTLEDLQNMGIPDVFFGWNPEFNGEIEFNNTAVDVAVGLDGSELLIGTQNSLLTKLFSITPFVSVGKPRYVNVKDGVEFEFGTGSNVDIHIEDDTLVINTDGTSSGSGGSTSGSGGPLKYKTLYSFESVSGDTFTFPTNLVFEKDVVYVAIVEDFVFNLYYDDVNGLINADGNVNVAGETYSVHLFHSSGNNTFSLTGRALSDGSDFPYTEHISQFDICQIVGGSSGGGTSGSTQSEVTIIPRSEILTIEYGINQNIFTLSDEKMLEIGRKICEYGCCDIMLRITMPSMGKTSVYNTGEGTFGGILEMEGLIISMLSVSGGYNEVSNEAGNGTDIYKYIYEYMDLTSQGGEKTSYIRLYGDMDLDGVEEQGGILELIIIYKGYKA